MWSKLVFLIILVSFVVYCDCNEENGLEARGKKKKKIALFVYIADLVLKKFFILKVVYAFVFWVVIHKAGYFLAWFASYLKEQKQQHHHPTFDYHHHGPYRKTYGVA